MTENPPPNVPQLVGPQTDDEQDPSDDLIDEIVQGFTDLGVDTNNPAAKGPMAKVVKAALRLAFNNTCDAYGHIQRPGHEGFVNVERAYLRFTDSIDI